jgi:hypothetical protein
VATKPKSPPPQDESAKLRHRLAQLERLHMSAIGQIGSCTETSALATIAAEIRQRLNPPPLVDLNAKADALIAGLSGQPWAKQILKEMEPKSANPRRKPWP